MDIIFKRAKFRKVCNKQKLLVKHYGDRMADLIRRRLDDLTAADNLRVMRFVDGRCHELRGNRKGQLSLDLVHPYRLIFTPAHDPIPKELDGGLDWERVTAVEIIGVDDTHE